MGPHLMKRPPKFVHGFLDRHGRPRFYFRRPGYPSVALPGLPWSPEFMSAYEQALGGQAMQVGAAMVRPGTMRALAVSYFNSTAFRSMSAKPQRDYRHVIERFYKQHGDKRAATLQREHGIAQAGDHRRAVFKRFPGPHIRAGRRHVLHPDRMAAEGDRGDLETDPCPGARLKEQKSNRLSDKSQRRRNPDLVGLRQLAEVVDVVDAERSGAQQVFWMACAGVPREIWRSLSGKFAPRLERRIRHTSQLQSHSRGGNEILT
jgi:hypothetical protein